MYEGSFSTRFSVLLISTDSLVCDGFYEWKKVPGGKIPYSIGMKDNSPFVFAGLWEGWKDPANGEWLHTTRCIRFRSAFCWRFPFRLSLLGIFLTSVQEILALINNYDLYESCGCSV
jgi:hypothetical protein